MPRWQHRLESLADKQRLAFEIGDHDGLLGSLHLPLHELKLVLATFLREAQLELAEPGEVKPARRNVVLGPDTGVRVVLRERRAHSRSAA